jgi:hypothetical protein
MSKEAKTKVVQEPKMAKVMEIGKKLAEGLKKVVTPERVQKAKELSHKLLSVVHEKARSQVKKLIDNSKILTDLRDVLAVYAVYALVIQILGALQFQNAMEKILISVAPLLIYAGLHLAVKLLADKEPK